MQEADADQIFRQLSLKTCQATGALRNGTRVRKVNSKPNDAHRDGDTGTIHGSLGPIDIIALGERYGYFVEWDSHPGYRVFVTESRIESADA